MTTFDPYSEAFFEDPWATYRWMRDEAPVFHHPELEFYAVSRYEDCVEVHRDHRTFTSTMGVTLDHPGLQDHAPVLYGDHTVPAETLERLAPQLLDTLRKRKSILVVNDVARDPHFAWLAPHAKQLIAVPLQRQDETLGCLFGLDKATGVFDSVDAKLLNSISNEAAIYLENAMLFEDVHDLMGLRCLRGV